MSVWLLVTTGLVLVGAGSTALLISSARRGETFLALVMTGLVITSCIYLAAHALLAHIRAV